jgi:UDP-N-acetylglucosamine 2-epimerase (non-hydrolysing)
MKMAPVLAALRRGPEPIPTALVHTGQHYDASMKDAFFEALGIPEPDLDLGVGSGTHAVQTAEVMRRFEPVLDRARPAAVLVVGDVNSTLACSLVASKKGVPVVHVEAGLRSYDRRMPEEVNRVLTDQLADLLFTTERTARENLIREGVDPGRIHFVGNVMIDSLHAHLPRAVPPPQVLGAAGAEVDLEQGYAVVTLHRPSNVDEPAVLRGILESLRHIGQRLPVVFPVHPRTRARIAAADLEGLLRPPLHALPPIGYLEMLGLTARARLVLTDSGGLQEETTALGVPCLTLRENTERPITLTAGTNTLVGSDPRRIVAAAEETLATGGKAGRIPELWDGAAARRIRIVLGAWLSTGPLRQAAAG